MYRKQLDLKPSLPKKKTIFTSHMKQNANLDGTSIIILFEIKFCLSQDGHQWYSDKTAYSDHYLNLYTHPLIHNVNILTLLN